MDKTIAIIFGILFVIVGIYLIWQSILIGLLSGYLIIAIVGSIGAGFIVFIGIKLVRHGIKNFQVK